MHNISLSIGLDQFRALKTMKSRGKYKSLSEMGRVAIRDFLNKELLLEKKIFAFNHGIKEKIIIDGKTFRVITKNDTL